VTSNAISRPTNVVVELNTIVKICKYKRLHEGHHFILVAMEVHSTPGRDMDCFIKEGAHLFHDSQSRGHLSLSFCIHFFRQHVNIASRCVNIIFRRVLSSAIENKIVLASDVYSKPPITMKSHNLHASDIRGVVGEIVSYHERDYFSSFFWFLQVVCLLAFLLCLPCDDFGHRSFIGFL
jgi:hypothetical protein